MYLPTARAVKEDTRKLLSLMRGAHVSSECPGSEEDTHTRYYFIITIIIIFLVHKHYMYLPKLPCSSGRHMSLNWNITCTPVVR